MKDQVLVLFLYLQKKLVAYYMQPHTLLVPYHYKKQSCGPTQKSGCIMGPRLLFFLMKTTSMTQDKNINWQQIRQILASLVLEDTKLHNLYKPYQIQQGLETMACSKHTLLESGKSMAKKANLISTGIICMFYSFYQVTIE